MTESRHPAASERKPKRERLDRLLGRIPDPTVLSVLGFIGLPAIAFERFEHLEDFMLFFLFGLWPYVKGVASATTGDDDQPAPTDWIDTGGRAATVRAYLGMFLLQFQPAVFVTSLLQLAGHVPILVRYRGRLPDPDSHDSPVDYRLPFEGEWTVVNGSPDRRYSHSWGILTQRYAHDLVITDESGRTHAGDRSGPEAHYCFGEPIVAPADGEVVAASDGHRDYHRTDGWLDPRQRDIRGNYVTIRHADGEYSVLAHLKRGSVAVSAGDRVERGDRIGRCGNSGNTTEPHLHFHVQDRPNFFVGMGLPVRFADVATRTPESDPVERDRDFVHAGQIVANAADAGE
ncbi:M23 family metallopeptidase [Halorussus marinus]|uniref:M23 family metallopeptidase n=1 Tax=Halorussus marinus TaxID=2505976 RepID=UPI00106ED700|nr:M23 family metallopeptidase [Halorussus marinus]